MTALKPIKFYSLPAAPNPIKISLLFAELNIPYETTTIQFDQVKSESFVSVNPNGRLPAIEDPNTGITIWESGAILIYLVETYDKEHRFSYAAGPEKYHSFQWLAFQISGQAPIVGNLNYFSFFAKNEVAAARFLKETERVVGVLDAWLGKKETGKAYLVGDKLTYVDLAFIGWCTSAFYAAETIDFKGKYPAYVAWYEEIRARKTLKPLLVEYEELTRNRVGKAETTHFEH